MLVSTLTLGLLYLGLVFASATTLWLFAWHLHVKAKATDALTLHALKLALPIEAVQLDGLALVGERAASLVESGQLILLATTSEAEQTRGRRFGKHVVVQLSEYVRRSPQGNGELWRFSAVSRPV